jgi:replicative DNA helicase
MPSHVELRLISKIIQTSDFRTILKQGIDKRMLSLPEARTMYNAIWKYYHNDRHPGAVPRKGWMERRYPAYRKIRVKESLPELCEEIRQDALSRKLIGIADNLEDRIRDDPYKALEFLKDSVVTASSMASSDQRVRGLHEFCNTLKEEYSLIEKSEGTVGMPFPWAEVNEETLGMHPEDLIILYGREKSMKTYTAVYIGLHAYFHANRRVMYFSAELPALTLARRAMCGIAGLDYDNVRKARLNSAEKSWWYTTLSSIEDDDAYVQQKTGLKRSFKLVTAIHGRRTSTVQDMIALAEELQPDLIIADAFYRLSNKKGETDLDWKSQGAIARDLKTAAQILKIPIIGVTQANRKDRSGGMAEGTDDLAFSNVLGQESDICMRVTKMTKKETREGIPLRFKFSAIRETRANGFYLIVNPFTRFDFLRWFTEEENTSQEEEEKEAPLKKNKLNKKEEATVQKYLSSKV